MQRTYFYHLGNVRATMSDMLLPRTGNDFDADLRTLTDYYPFGMTMPGRSYEAAGIDAHRNGYNGKENDNEVKGEGNSLDYGARIYDPRVGRWLSVDPLAGDYSWQTPYAYHRNSPVFALDWNGYGDPPFVKNNVLFIHFKSPTVTPVNRSAGETFAQAALRVNTAKDNEYIVNMQMFELLSTAAEAKYTMGLLLDPSEVRTQGYTVHNGKVSPGGRQSDSYFIAQGKDGKWSAGRGTPPLDSKVAFGGGMPILINGMPFGRDKKYDESGSMIQNSSSGYPGQNLADIGKTILAFNDKGDFMIVSQPDGVQGMTLDHIKANLQTLGYTNAVSFDGSTSATLVKDGSVIHQPSSRKNNAMPVGAKVNE